MSRPIVKVCGVTEASEIDDLCTCGVDYFGLVVDLPFPWSIDVGRAKKLVAHARDRIKATLIGGSNQADKVARLVSETGASAVQLGPLTLPRHLRELRTRFPHDRLAVLQAVPYADGQFLNEEQINDYLGAGADFILIDRLRQAGQTRGAAPATIPTDDLVAFRDRHVGQPVLVAGGITSENVAAIMKASGAIGIDVCSSVRRDGLIRRDLVGQLLGQLSPEPVAISGGRPSLRRYLSAMESGNHAIAYLTIGDPPGRFSEVAEELLAAGTLTLELGFPTREPREGAAITASHHRAIDAGVDDNRALEMLKAVARAHPQTPLIAVVQWPAIQAEDQRNQFLDGLADAGAAAVLPVGMPLWQLAALSTAAGHRGLQTVIPCPPEASKKLREIVFRFCTGCVYVPQAAVTGGAKQFTNVAQFCRLAAEETDLPIIVGVGIKSAQDVAEVCATAAKAAAVGSALVEHIAAGGSAGQFLRRLIDR